MADYDDALTGFMYGLRGLATQTAITDARKQLDQVNLQAKNQDERLQQAQIVGQDLALRLSQPDIGADANQIQAATQGLVPRADTTATIAGSAKEKELDRQNARELQKMKNEALVGKAKQKEGGFITDYQKRYNKETEKSRQAIGTMDQAISVLQSGNPVGHSSMGALFARAAGDVGNLSEYEQANYGGSQALVEKINNIKTKWESGQMSPANKKFMLELADLYKQSHTRRLSEVADRYTNQAQSAAAARGSDFSPEELRVAITGQKPEEQKPANPRLEKAKAWLADPKNANHPKRKDVEQKIKQLEQSGG